MLNNNDLLNPNDLQKIQDYEVLAKTIVDGYFFGQHKSYAQGGGLEFIHYRNYIQGDDLKYIDWKAAARSDKFYTKIFEEETTMDCHLVLDLSASMNYTSPTDKKTLNKLQYAKMISAALVWLINKQGDRISFTAANDKIHCHFDPTSKIDQVQGILATLPSLSANNTLNISKLQNFLSENLKNRGLFILISDMLQDENELINLLTGFKSNNHDCIIIQILHPDELHLPFEGSFQFIDSELNQSIVTSPESIRSEYINSIQSYLESVKNKCLANEIEIIQTDTSKSIYEIINKIAVRSKRR